MAELAEQPTAAPPRIGKQGDPCVMVIFGAAGDLTCAVNRWWARPQMSLTSNAAITAPIINATGMISPAFRPPQTIKKAAPTVKRTAVP